MSSFMKFLFKGIALLSFIFILFIAYKLSLSGYMLYSINSGILLGFAGVVFAVSVIIAAKPVKADTASDEADIIAEQTDNIISENDETSETETEPEEPLFTDPIQTSSDKSDILLAKEIHAFLSKPKEAVEMDLIVAANEAMKSLTPFAEAQKIKLHLSTACESIIMLADPESIKILFRNIIDNSIKYMGRPGHMIITISLLGDDIFLILKDTGKGLSEEETTHVFELNFQGSNRVSGNGLGLTQTKMIVEAFGGTIYAKSSPGNGMAIYIQLPVSGTQDK